MLELNDSQVIIALDSNHKNPHETEMIIHSQFISVENLQISLVNLR